MSSKRTGAQHRDLSFEFRLLQSDREQQGFFKTNGVRYTELCRLRYFDAIRMTVVDPMHNILLGEFVISAVQPNDLSNLHYIRNHKMFMAGRLGEKINVP